MGLFIVGVTIALLPLAIVGYCAAKVALARPLAIRDGRQDVDLFLGFMRLHLWEQNEGLVSTGARPATARRRRCRRAPRRWSRGRRTLRRPC